MNKKIFSLVLASFVLLSLPALSLAHTGSTTNTDSMPMMSAEPTNQVSVEEFEEMEEIMLKMMNGQELTQSQWQDMQDFMENHHGSFAPLGQMMWDTNQNYMHHEITPMGSGVMWRGYGTFMMWIFTLSVLIWLLVGILLATYLVKKLNKKQS